MRPEYFSLSPHLATTESLGTHQKAMNPSSCGLHLVYTGLPVFSATTVEWFDTGEPWSSFLRSRHQVDLLTSGSDDRAGSLLVPGLTLLVCEVGVLVFPAS